MDTVSVQTPAIFYDTLTYARARYYGTTLISLGADQPWETWSIANLLSDRPVKWELSLIATWGEHPVGYAIASARADSVHLHRLIVGKQWRGHNIGRHLLSCLARKAQSIGKKHVSLKVHKQNRKAIAFYLRRGFSITEEEHSELSTMLAHVTEILARESL